MDRGAWWATVHGVSESDTNRATIAFSFGVVGGGARLTGGTPEVPVTAHAEHSHPASSLRVNLGLPGCLSDTARAPLILSSASVSEPMEGKGDETTSLSPPRDGCQYPLSLIHFSALKSLTSFCPMPWNATSPFLRHLEGLKKMTFGGSPPNCQGGPRLQASHPQNTCICCMPLCLSNHFD